MMDNFKFPFDDTTLNFSHEYEIYKFILPALSLSFSLSPETPATATDRIFFESNDVYQRAPSEVRITWNALNLTTNANANIRISLFGYRESTIR